MGWGGREQVLWTVRKGRCSLCMARKCKQSLALWHWGRVWTDTDLCSKRIWKFISVLHFWLLQEDVHSLIIVRPWINIFCKSGFHPDCFHCVSKSSLPLFPAVTSLLMRTAFTESAAFPNSSAHTFATTLCVFRITVQRFSQSFQSSGDDNCDREVCLCLGDAVPSGRFKCW